MGLVEQARNKFKKQCKCVENIMHWHDAVSQTNITARNAKEFIKGDRHLSVLKITLELQISYGHEQSNQSQ